MDEHVRVGEAPFLDLNDKEIGRDLAQNVSLLQVLHESFSLQVEHSRAKVRKAEGCWWGRSSALISGQYGLQVMVMKRSGFPYLVGTGPVESREIASNLEFYRGGWTIHARGRRVRSASLANRSISSATSYSRLYPMNVTVGIAGNAGNAGAVRKKERLAHRPGHSRCRPVASSAPSG